MAAVAVPICFMLCQLSLPIWFDEAYTIGSYASKPISEIITDYSTPNNHVAYSLLIHCLCGFQDYPWVLRLPSILTSSALLVALFCFVARHADSSAAGVSVVLLGLNQVFLNYAAQIRGYSLSMLLGVLIAAAALENTEDKYRIWRSAFIVVLGAIWVYVIPTNILFLVGISGTAVALRFRNSGRRAAAQEVVRWILAILLAIGLYLPIVRQVFAAKGTSAFSYEGLFQSIAALFASLLRDVPMKVAFLAGGIGALLLVRHRDLFKPPARNLVALGLAVIAGSFVTAAAIQIAPFSRNFVPLLPFIAMLAGVSISALGEWMAHRWYLKKHLKTAMVAIVVIQTCFLLSFPDRLESHRQAGMPEDPYFLFTSAKFDPGQAVLQVARARLRRDYYACVMTERAWQNLGFQFNWFDCPPVNHDDDGLVSTLFLIAMCEPEIKTLASQNGLSAKSLADARHIDVPGFVVLEVSLTMPMAVDSLSLTVL